MVYRKIYLNDKRPVSFKKRVSIWVEAKFVFNFEVVDDYYIRRIMKNTEALPLKLCMRIQRQNLKNQIRPLDSENHTPYNIL